MKYDAVVAGHICLDIAPAFGFEEPKPIPEIFVPGKLVNMEKMTMSTGGPVSNTGLALLRLGVPTTLMGKIGRDEPGGVVLRLLEPYGAQGCMTVVDGEETAYTVVIVPPGYDRIFLHNPGANNTFHAGDIDYAALEKARLFHFGYPPLMRRMFEEQGAELVEIFKRAKATGVTTSLDMSLPDVHSASGRADWDGILQRLLPYVDIFLPSVEETMFMVQREEFDFLQRNAGDGDMLEFLDINKLPALGGILLEYGAKIAAVKCGVKGFYIRTAGAAALAGMGRAKPGNPAAWAGRELHEESFHVEKIASATGSGDSSIAGFLAAFLRGMEVEDCIKTACCTGGQNVRVMDALSGIHTFEETRAMIHGWEKNTLDIAGAYWQYRPDRQVWAGKNDPLHG